MSNHVVMSLLLLLSGATEASAAPMGETPADTRVLRLQTVVAAPSQAAWTAWTTAQGLRFASAQSNVELRAGGPYELFLDLPPDEVGRRGSEGSQVLAWLPGRMLAFTWTFPPSIPSLRQAGETTQVVLLFDAVGPDRTRVSLYQHGWQSGADWDRGYAYFEGAWAAVLERFRTSME